MHFIKWLIIACCLLAPSVLQADEPAKPLPPDHAERMKEGTKLFKEHVRTILIDRCLKCHGGESVKGELDLSTRELLLESKMIGDDAASSHLFAVVTHREEPHMPKDADKLSDDALAHLERWLNLGAPYDQPLIDHSAQNTEQKPRVISQKERQFWSFQKLGAIPPPDISNNGWVRTPIDSFVLSQLQKLGIHPNPIADRRILIRRAYFDLIGLPPTPEEVDAFVNDSDPAAYEKLIDRLLESPHYGERWARHWMDVARFAESHGYEQDYDRTNAYPYRDFLIKAFNQDLPYNQFVSWQLAGDELAPNDQLAMTATGFLGAGAFPTQLTEMEFESARYDELDDMGNTLSTALLGLSVGARCHDHKYDPIPSSDYYRLLATFTKTIRNEVDIDLDPEGNRQKQAIFTAKRDQLKQQLDQYERESGTPALQQFVASYDPAVEKAGNPTDPKVKEALAHLKQTFDANTEDYRTAAAWFATTLPDWQTRQQDLEQFEKGGAGLNVLKAQITSEGLPHMSHHADDRGFPHFYPETYILNRGDVTQKKEVASPAYLQVLMSDGYDTDHWHVTPPEGWTRTSFARASLSNWITDPQHGAGDLLARVMVNRLWQHHFGRGIVSTPNDFGAQGERPTHPELLDWLAVDLIHHGWKLKRLHKLIMTSAVYMQNSAYDEQRAQVDRENRFLWRHMPMRLEAEPIRDSMLKMSGMLDERMYGSGSLDPSMTRRSVYFFIKRSQLIPMMMLFDWPEHLVGIGQRASTTIAPQALAFMNSPQCRQYAEGFAHRIESFPKNEAISRAYAIAYGRTATDRESQLAQEFLARQESAYQAAGQSSANFLALVDLCQTLMSMNEFVYID